MIKSISLKMSLLVALISCLLLSVGCVQEETKVAQDAVEFEVAQ